MFWRENCLDSGGGGAKKLLVSQLMSLGEDRVMVHAASQEMLSNTSNIYANSFPHSIVSEWPEANGVEPHKHISHPASLSQGCNPSECANTAALIPMLFFSQH